MIGLGMLNYVTPAIHQCTIIHLKPIIMTSYRGWSLSCGPSEGGKSAMGPYCSQYKSIVCFFFFPDCLIARLQCRYLKMNKHILVLAQSQNFCVLLCLLVFIICPKCEHNKTQILCQGASSIFCSNGWIRPRTHKKKRTSAIRIHC